MSLAVKRLEAYNTCDNPVELVLIHGWGTSHIIWQQWLEILRHHCHISMIDLPGYGINVNQPSMLAEQLVDAVGELLPERSIVMGYSLGGMLAAKLAEKFPKKIAAIISLSSNLKFVADEAWPNAMAGDTYSAFLSLVEKKPAVAVKRFVGLQVHGDRNEKELIKKLKDIQKISLVNEDALVNSLNLLASINNVETVKNIDVPALYLFGENDSLVPVSAAESMQVSSSSVINVLPEMPHCLFYADPQLVWKVIESFLIEKNVFANSERIALEKKQVAKSFSRAAKSYDEVADLQRRVGESLCQFFPVDNFDKDSIKVVVDLGCGTGFFAPKLSEEFPAAQLLGVDLAEGMVSHAKTTRKLSAAQWLCGDAESLPLADNAVDVIFSSLSIQWCENNTALFAEVFRVLKPGGVFLFSTLGPDTLFELKKSWEVVDNFVHVNKFVERQVLTQAASDAGFLLDVAESFWLEEDITLEFSNLKNLTHELKALGAHNVNAGRPQGLTGRQRIQGLINAYEQQRNVNGMLPASYQVFYGRLVKPADISIAACEDTLCG